MDFKTKYAEMSKDKGVLCVGLDPVLKAQLMKEAIPIKYEENYSSSEARLRFCLDIIDQVRNYAVAVKPNQQFVFGFTEEQHQILTKYARKADLLSILDYKLNDIGKTVSTALFHLKIAGYDAVTFNPFPGNMEESVKVAHANDIGLIALTLMSNPEAETFMRNATVNGRPLYEEVARQVKLYNADGCVVGATGHVTEQDALVIQSIAGEDKTELIPGVGVQGGDARNSERSNIQS